MAQPGVCVAAVAGTLQRPSMGFWGGLRVPPGRAWRLSSRGAGLGRGPGRRHGLVGTPWGSCSSPHRLANGGWSLWARWCPLRSHAWSPAQGPKHWQAHGQCQPTRLLDLAGQWQQWRVDMWFFRQGTNVLCTGQGACFISSARACTGLVTVEVTATLRAETPLQLLSTSVCIPGPARKGSVRPRAGMMQHRLCVSAPGKDLERICIRPRRSETLWQVPGVRVGTGLPFRARPLLHRPSASILLMTASECHFRSLSWGGDMRGRILAGQACGQTEHRRVMGNA